MRKVTQVVEAYVKRERERPRYVVVAKNPEGVQIVAFCGTKPAIFNDAADAELHAAKLREGDWNNDSGFTVRVEALVIL